MRKLLHLLGIHHWEYGLTDDRCELPARRCKLCRRVEVRGKKDKKNKDWAFAWHDNYYKEK